MDQEHRGAQHTTTTTTTTTHSINSAMPWVEKYRPSCFDEIVLDPMNRTILSNIPLMEIAIQEPIDYVLILKFLILFFLNY